MGVISLPSYREGKRGLGILFANGMFGNPIAQDDLYHHFRVLADCSTIYDIRKREKGTICHLMVRHVLHVSSLLFN